MGTYDLKPGFQRLLRPAVVALQRHAVTPDAVTLAGVGFAALAGVGFALGAADPAWLLLVPPAVALRTAANAVDGELARITGTDRPMGQVLNEVGDRVGDIVVIAPMALVPGVDPLLVVVALVVSLLSSYLGVAAAAAGGPRAYVGVMAKPDRMVLVGAGSFLAVWLGTGVLDVVAWIISIGAVLTFIHRWLWIKRSFGGGDV